jgi:predicted hydrocarbon binding protein
MAEPEVKDIQEEGAVGFLHRDQTTGELRNASNKRAVVMTVDLWKALTNSLEERLSGEFDEVLYSAGRAWGAAAFAEFTQKVSASQRTLYHTRNMGLSDFKQAFNDYLIRHGWGRFDIYEKYDLIFADLFASAFPEMLRDRGVMTCSLMAGFFSGFFSDLTGVDLSCIELRCAALGTEKCTFVMGDSALTASVRKWLSKGRSFDEIVAAIGAKEYQAKK